MENEGSMLDKRPCAVLFGILAIFFSIQVQGTFAGSCGFQVSPIREPHDYSITKGVPVDSFLVKTHSRQSELSFCKMDICDQLHDLPIDNNSQRMLSVHFLCGDRTEVYFESCELHTQLLISLEHCQVSLSSLIAIRQDVNLRGIFLLNVHIVYNNNNGTGAETVEKTDYTSSDDGLESSSLDISAEANTSKDSDKISEQSEFSKHPNSTERKLRCNLRTFQTVNSNIGLKFDHLFPVDVACPNLTKLHLVNSSFGNSLTELNQRFPGLIYINISKNSLQEVEYFYSQCVTAVITPGSQNRGYNDNVFRLDLPTNTQISTLVLDYNRMTSLKGLKLSGCLHVLSLVGNNISETGHHIFSNLTELRYLNLSKNSLTTVPKICPETSCRVRELDLSYNKLTYLNSWSFLELKSLKLLDLAHNHLSQIHTGTFSMLSDLHTLYLQFNQIERLSRDILPSDSVSLKTINLSHNPLRVIPASTIVLPKIVTIDLSHCHIDLSSLDETLKEIDHSQWLQYLGDKYTTGTQSEHPEQIKKLLLKRSSPYTRFLDLSNNNITFIPVPSSKNCDLCTSKYDLVFVHIKINLDRNPLKCDCQMGDFLLHMRNRSTSDGDGTFQDNEYFYKDWKCSDSSVEFHRRAVLSLRPQSLYCSTNLLTCPSQCSCYTFYGNRGILTACSDEGLLALPASVPTNTVDLRLNNNKIADLSPKSYFRNLQSLQLSNNTLSNISNDVLKQLPNLKYIYLDHNQFHSLPRGVTRMPHISQFWLGHNPYKCDCNSMWLKSWLAQNTHRLPDLDDIFCVKYDNSVEDMLSVANEDFVCTKKKSKLFYHIAMSIVTVITVGIIGGAIAFVYRLELRAVVYDKVSVKVLDTVTLPTKDDVIPVLLLVCTEDMSFCDRLLSDLGLSRDKSVILLTDLIAGLSINDNISYMVKHSFRALALISRNFFQDELCVQALQKALTKARSKKEYLVLIRRESHQDSTGLPDLRRFFKTQRYYCLKESEGLLTKKVKYLLGLGSRGAAIEMCSAQKSWIDTLITSPGSRRDCTHDVFIAHHDNDYVWVVRELRAKLENAGFRTQLPDSHFIPGDDVQDNILNSVLSCRYVLLVLSPAYIATEWALFVLRNLYEKVLLENNNSLIVIKTEPIEPVEDRDLSVYLQTHVCIDKSDPDWWDKLCRSLIKQSYPSCDNELGQGSTLVNPYGGASCLTSDTFRGNQVKATVSPVFVSDDAVSGDVVSGDVVSDDVVSGDVVSGDVVSDVVVSGDVVSDDVVSGDVVSDDVVSGDVVSDDVVSPFELQMSADNNDNDDSISSPPVDVPMKTVSSSHEGAPVHTLRERLVIDDPVMESSDMTSLADSQSGPVDNTDMSISGSTKPNSDIYGSFADTSNCVVIEVSDIVPERIKESADVA